MNMLAISCIFLILLTTTEASYFDDTYPDDFCTQNEDGVKCDNVGRNRLTRLDGGEVGDVVPIEVDGKVLQMKTVNLKPLIFEIEDFLTDEECDHFISAAQNAGLESTPIGKRADVSFVDLDGNQRICPQEMMISIENAYNMYLDEDDIISLYVKSELDENYDNHINREEMSRVQALNKFNVLLEEFVMDHPEKHSEYNKKTWLYEDGSSDPIYKEVQKRVSKVVKLPVRVMKNTEFQVIRYGVNGHYNAHLDSQMVNPAGPCCGQGIVIDCKICRYMTVMFYLNDVDMGGETAFPLANQEHIGGYFQQRLLVGNLFKNCGNVNLRITPKKGKALLWYNHIVDPKTGETKDMDESTLHGDCKVISGEKWTANFFIRLFAGIL